MHFQEKNPKGIFLELDKLIENPPKWKNKIPPIAKTFKKKKGAT